MKYFFLYSLLIISFFSCKSKLKEKEKTAVFALSKTMKAMIEIDTVRYCTINDELTLTGEVMYNENAVSKIYPRASGFVVEANVTLGDRIKAGQVLAVIKSADIAGNYADLSSADADIAITKRQMDNTKSLLESGLASERTYTEAKQNYEKALAAKRKIEASLVINGGKNTNTNGTYQLISPIDGFLVGKKINTGNFIRADLNEAVFTISDLKTIWVYANVFEVDIPKVREGYDVDVTTLSYPDKIFKGSIDNISHILDPTNKTMQIRIKLPNENYLLQPEMFAKVIVKNDQKTNAVCVPTKSLLSLNSKDYIVAYLNDSTMNVIEVNILKTVGEKTYLRAGLKSGEKIITKNQLLVFQELIK